MDERWWILGCCTIIGFTLAFFTMAPASLVQRLTGTAGACLDQTDHCTHLDIKQFNLLFSTSSWASAFGAIFAGFITDHFGCRLALFGSSLFVGLGGFLFVIGTYLNEATAVFAVMEVGNILFGLASGSLSVISHRIKSSWFFYKELALAFSVQVFFGRFGSATSFLIIGALVDRIGLQPCLWIAFGLLLLNCGICIVLAVLDARGPAIITAAPPGSRTKVLWNFVKSLDGVFWCFTLMVFLYYGTVGAFTANGPNFIAKAYGYSESTASYLGGIVYDVSLFAVLFGWLADKFGKREHWLLGAAILLFFAFFFESVVPHFPAWLLTTIVGFGYTIFGLTFWSSVALLVLPASLGTAMGVLKFCQYAGTGILEAVAGTILKSNAANSLPWQGFLVMLLFGGTLCLGLTVLMVFLNVRTGRKLTPSQPERDEKRKLLEVSPVLAVQTSYGSAMDLRKTDSKSLDNLPVKK